MPAPFGIAPQGGDQAMLDQPPPSPAQPMVPTQGLQGSLAGLGSSPGVPSGLIPPEILAGLMQSASQIDQQLDTFAQITPDLAADWADLKARLQAVMGKLLVAGGSPPSPTAPGRPFPGGGINSGGGAV